MNTLPVWSVHIGALHKRKVIHKSGDVELIITFCVVETKGVNVLSVVVVVEVCEFREHGDNVREIHRTQLVDLRLNVPVIACKCLQKRFLHSSGSEGNSLEPIESLEYVVYQSNRNGMV